MFKWKKRYIKLTRLYGEMNDDWLELTLRMQHDLSLQDKTIKELTEKLEEKNKKKKESK